MDEKQLKEILNHLEPPEANENARKRAVNLAMAEFEKHQSEKSSKKSQGLSFLSRLMGNSTDEQRRDSMEQRSKNRLIYGGLATACVALLIGGVSMTQLSSLDLQNTAGTMRATLDAVEFDAVNRVDSASSTIGAEQVSPKKEMAQRRSSEGKAAALFAPQEAELAEEQVAMGDVAAPRAFAVPSQSLGKKAPGSAAPALLRQNQLSIAPEMDRIAPMPEVQNRDTFSDFEINPVKLVQEDPVSTFSIDVDTASYSFVRKQINQGRLPNSDAVRIEEMINYFDYNYPLPETREQPFKPTVTLVNSPFSEGKQLMHIGIQGFDVDPGLQPKANLVFLLDVSGSMGQPDKLPLVKDSMKMLLDTLKPDDTVAIAVYAGAAGTVLEPTAVRERSKIYEALNNLQAGGSTAGGSGINLAYNLAEQNFDDDAVNRVILATDGDFNVGVSNHEELKAIIEQKREKGIFLSVLGFGQGNLNDQLMQTLAQNGNGVAAYIDSLNEARKVLIDEATSTLFPIAKDVKIQVEFNPSQVAEYRLIGYETRALKREDFNNDQVDAGDIGAGHSVTAIYEITPVGSEAVSVDPLRYGAAEGVEKTKADTDFSNEIAFLKMRYKLPNEDTSKLITTPVTNQLSMLKAECGPTQRCLMAPPDVKFSIAVAGFGQLLKHSKYSGTFAYDDVIDLAQEAKGEDKFGYRTEFINLVRNAKVFANR